MPKLWTRTIETHRREVREAILDTTWALVAEHGLLSVTMSQIAERTGIGRATLYKYFPDVVSILHAWHERHISGHLAHLAEIRDQAGDPGDRLESVLRAYALISHKRARHDTELGAILHGPHHNQPSTQAQQQLHDLVCDLLAEGAAAGALRDDVPPDELAVYCLHALGAARSLSSEAAVHRLIAVTLTGLLRHAEARPPVHPATVSSPGCQR